MQPDLVSVMMPAYNAERYIGQAIESVLSQSYPQWELILVNDGSTDHTAQIAAQFVDRRIKVVHRANGGESAARNTALGHMQGEFIAFLDADDIYLPHHLEAATDFLLTHLDCDGVYTDGYYVDQHGTRLQLLSSRRRGPFEGHIYEQMVRSSDVFGAPVCVVLRRRPIDQYQLRFDERIVIGPDWDFLTQYAAETSFGYVHQPTCLYRVHDTNISLRVDRQRRASYLALCREKAIKMDQFSTCSPETRSAVFYSLLIDLLAGLPERQAEIVAWKEFEDLPVAEQARLYRLMASKTLMLGGCQAYVHRWLSRARELYPADRRGALLAACYGVSPRFCALLLRAKNMSQHKKTSPHSLVDVT